MRRRLLVLALLLLVPAGSASAYPWPFKPFDRPHPIRGFFGDPRTVYENGILAGAFEGPGTFSFHQGIDISAPDGTPLYAIANGTVRFLGSSTLNLVTDRGVTFQFFHIVSVVSEGQRVVARKTVLGYVQPPFQHVHMSEIVRGRVVNPLQKRHLTPYRDTTKPVIRGIHVRNAAGEVQTVLGLCGRVELDLEAFDMPSVPVPGKFNGLPVAPSLVQWRLTRLGDPAAGPWHTVADFRRTVPEKAQFWDVYARGSYQNAPRFGREQYASMPGRFLFLLAKDLDTRRLANGVYVVTVRVGDAHGHTTTATQRISVLNAKDGSCPGSVAAPPGAPPPDEPTP